MIYKIHVCRKKGPYKHLYSGYSLPQAGFDPQKQRFNQYLNWPPLYLQAPSHQGRVVITTKIKFPIQHVRNISYSQTDRSWLEEARFIIPILVSSIIFHIPAFFENQVVEIPTNRYPLPVKPLFFGTFTNDVIEKWFTILLKKVCD